MKNFLPFTLSAAAILLAACAKDKEFPTPITAPTPPVVVDAGFVRLVNNLATSPGSQVQQGSLQLEVDYRPLGPAAPVAAATPYQTLPAGDRAVWIRLPATSGSAWVQFSRLSIAKDRRYSLFTYSSGTHHSARVIEEAALPAPVAGKAQLRVLNLAAESTPIRIQEPQAAAPLYSQVAWGGITSYQPVDARSYTLLTSRTNGDQEQLFRQAVALIPGKAYTLVLRGSHSPDVVAPEKLAFDLIEDE